MKIDDLDLLIERVTLMEELNIKNKLINYYEEENNKLKEKIEENRLDNCEIIENREVKELRKEENERLKKQNNNYPKEYQDEAEEYFHHNPQCKSLLFYMIPFEDFDIDDNSGLNGLQGEFNSTLYLDECLIQIDNKERSI